MRTKMIMILLLCGVSFTAFAQRTNFSGKYKINKDRTEFGRAPEYVLPRYITVSQEKKRVLISRIWIDAQLKETPVVADSLLFSGTIFKGKTATGNTSSSKLKWLNDQSFQLDIAINNPEGTKLMNIIEVWKLEEGRKTLFIDRAVEQGTMKYTTKAYFDRIVE